MRKGTKHAQVSPIQMVLNGGLNYSSTPTNLADNEVRRANNFIYDPSTDSLMTRPGTVCQTAATCDGTNPILAIYPYEHSASETFLIGVCNGNLYYLSASLEGYIISEDGEKIITESGEGVVEETATLGGPLNAWTLIGSLTDTTTAPSFLTFNTKLLIADGGSTIKTWDGTTYGTIAGSPKATALAMIKNRVVANHIDEPDSVYLSSSNDAETAHTTGVTGAWYTNGGTAVGLKAGFGDNLTVKGFGVYGDDLMVFKKGKALKRIYRVNVSDATTTSWYVKPVSENNSAQNAQSVAEAWNNIFFVDNDGFKSIKGTDIYGDLAVDSIGNKINNLFTSQTVCDFMTYIPKYNTIWFGMGDRTYCYTERPTTDSSTGSASTEPAFTDLTFKQGRIRSICQLEDNVYLAGHDGFLYKLDESKSTDAIGASTTVNFTSTVRTKTIAFPAGGILKKLQWYFRPKNSGIASMTVYTSETSNVLLKNIVLPGTGIYLYDATGYLHDATDYLYGQGAIAWMETTRNRVRNTEMAFEILVTSGRVGIEWVKVEIAMVEG